MITGYLLYRVRVPPKIPFVINLGLWIVSIFILLSIVFGVTAGRLSLFMTAFYVSLGHTGKAALSIYFE